MGKTSTSLNKKSTPGGPTNSPTGGKGIELSADSSDSTTASPSETPTENSRDDTPGSTIVDPFANEVYWGRFAWADAGIPKLFYELIQGNTWEAIIDRGDQLMKVVRGAKGFAQWQYKFGHWAWKPGLFMSGRVGCGKTLIACHIIHEMILRAQGVGQPMPGGAIHEAWYPVFRFCNISHLINQIKATFGRKSVYEASMAHIVGPLEGADVLVLDDIGAEAPTDWVGEFLFGLVDTRYGAQRTTIFTSNYTLDELADRSSYRVADRIAEMCAGHIYRIDASSYRLEIAKRGTDDSN